MQTTKLDQNGHVHALVSYQIIRLKFPHFSHDLVHRKIFFEIIQISGVLNVLCS